VPTGTHRSLPLRGRAALSSRPQEGPMVEWTGGALPTFVTHLECSLTGERYPADILQTLSKAGRPLLVRYDLDGVRRALPREMLAGRPQTFWRYRELLPVRRDRKSTRLNSSHLVISYAVFCLKKK